MSALPTRDAILPILCTLFSAQEQGLAIGGLFSKLPRRFSRAALLKQFPRAISDQIVRRFTPLDPDVKDVLLEGEKIVATDDADQGIGVTAASQSNLEAIRRELETYFAPELGFGSITRLNYTDGVRVTFDNADVAHLRPSGNADELRIYAAADTQKRAEQIAQFGIADPGGILRRMQASVQG